MKFNIILIILLVVTTTNASGFLNDETNILFSNGLISTGGSINESVVESYIFDDDNTGSLRTTGGIYASLFNASQFFSTTLTLQRIGATSYLYAQPHPFLELFSFGHISGANAANFLFDAPNNKIALSSSTTLCDSGFTNCGTTAQFLAQPYVPKINQALNTTSSVRFKDSNSTRFVKVGSSTQQTASVAGVLQVAGNYTTNVVGGLLGITGSAYGGILAAVIFSPVMYTNNPAQVFRFSPQYGSAYNHNGLMLLMNPPAHTATKNDSFQAYAEQDVPRTFFSFSNDRSKVKYDWFNIGGLVTLGDSGVSNVDYTETMIKLTGGSARAFGTNGRITQTGLQFTGFGTIGSNTVVKAINVTGGGIFDFSKGTDFRIPVATSRPSSPADGTILLNTAINAVQIYAEGAWRNMTTY